MKNKQNNQKIQVRNVILAIALATIVFILGISLGNIITESKYNFLVETTQDLKTRSVSLQILGDLYEEFPCEILESSTVIEELDTLGNRLTYIEQVYGKTDSNVITLKKEYSQILIKNWIDVSKSKEHCDVQKDLVLYFYSNENCDSCEDQGKILTAFKNKYDDKVNIYSLDVDIEEIALETLIEILNITTVPTIVFNDQHLNYTTMNELEELKTQKN